MKTPITMTALLFAATLGLQAQTSSSTQSQSDEQQRKQQQSQYGSSAQSSSGQSAIGSDTQSSQSSSNQFQTDAQRREQERKDKEKNQNKYSQNQSSSSSSQYSADASKKSQDQGSAQNRSSSQTDLKYSSNQPAEVQKKSDGSSSTSLSSTSQSTTGAQVNSQTNVAVSGQADTEVRTIVQQIDAQGPVVVDRISTRFADVTCTEENARALVEALHSGTSVTLRGDNGQTATFTPTTHLGYGDAYIAMALAVEALKKAGITGCASPAQWQAVLMGGQLSGGSTTVTSTSTQRFPGILVLHEQGGWTKVSQTTNVQLNQVVSEAHSSLQIDSSKTQTANSTNQKSENSNLSPTGRSSDYNARDQEKSKYDTPAQEDKADKSQGDEHGKKLGHDMNAPAADDPNNPAKTEQPQARPNQSQ